MFKFLVPDRQWNYSSQKFPSFGGELSKMDGIKSFELAVEFNENQVYYYIGCIQ
jgi:hypothetical protein